MFHVSSVVVRVLAPDMCIIVLLVEGHHNSDPVSGVQLQHCVWRLSTSSSCRRLLLPCLLPGLLEAFV